jgi:hypothetical protein
MTQANNPKDSTKGETSELKNVRTIDEGGASGGKWPPIAGGANAPVPPAQQIPIPLPVTIQRSARLGGADVLTWFLIQRTTDHLSFNNYLAFMDYLLCGDEAALGRMDGFEAERARGAKTVRAEQLRARRSLPFTDTDAYRILKVATEAFVTVNCGVPLGQRDLPNVEAPDRHPDLTNLLALPEVDALLSSINVTTPFGTPGLLDDFFRDYLRVVNGDGHLTLPYLDLIRHKLGDLDVIQRYFGDIDRLNRRGRAASPSRLGDSDLDCYGILMEKLNRPCFVELIWSYWHEEGMQIQTMNALTRRFQNVRGPGDRDPLAMVELDPLRPLNNLIWGYIQDEQHRLSVVRRTYEYNHHYGLTLEGKAIPPIRPADPRTRFLEAFHILLYQCSVFYKQDDDTTVIADGFPVLNALRDLHMVLSEGAHNQFGDLPETARIEMLMDQWLLARPEFREFLPRRMMVAYPEPWMDSVDAMKRMQGWTDTSIMDFNFLARDGERILLSTRFTAWSAINDAVLAGIWARMFRNEVHRYIHSYRAVTGVDLAAAPTTSQQRELITTRPSVLLRQKAEGRHGSALSAGSARALPPGGAPAPGFRQRRVLRSGQPPVTP